MSSNNVPGDGLLNYTHESNKDSMCKYESRTVEIKIENANDSCAFENIQIEIKRELDTEYNEFSPENPKESGINDNSLVDVSSVKSDGTPSEIKTETGSADSPSGQSEFQNNDDAESMDSSEAVALRNVETCLQEELDIKTENDAVYEDLREEADKVNVKVEEEAASDAHSISNNLIKSTSTVTSAGRGLDTTRAANSLVMEIHPLPTDESTCGKINNPEEILPTINNDVEYGDHFQLNSITGNVLTLEQEAYGLLQAKVVKPKVGFKYPCPECTKMFRIKTSLTRHLEVHRSIEARAMGIVKGMNTRKVNQAKPQVPQPVKKEITKVKKVRRECKYIQLKNADSVDKIKVAKKMKKKKKDKISEPTLGAIKDKEIKAEPEINKEGYVCTCGKVFQRRSRLETCLRSHTEYADTGACFSCVTCSKQFKDKDALSMHRKKQHRKRFPCKFCPTDYNTRKELFRHLQIHQKVQLMEYKVISEVMEGKQKLKCFMCTKSYVELSELKTHVMENHKEPFACKFCKEVFPKIIDFANHMKVAHSEVQGQTVLDVLEAFSKLVQAWKCEDCGLQFHEADKLALHQIEQHNPDLKADNQFQCSDCRRVFISQKALTSHRRVHHSVDSTEEVEVEPQGVMCLECRKMCKDMTALTSHMRLHSPERKYPCKFCDFRFATPEKRKTHAEVHTGDMKYVCFICEYQCTSENRLKLHKVSLKHLNMKEFLLTGKPLIEEESTSKEKIKDTSRKKDSRKRKSSSTLSEETQISCDVCGEHFADEPTMLEHKQTHPFIEFPNEDTPTRIFFK